MKSKHTISKEIKEQILERIRKEGKPIAQIARDHGIHPSTIYSWMERKAASPQHYKELIKLRKEKQTLMEIIGSLTVQLSQAEKKETSK